MPKCTKKWFPPYNSLFNANPRTRDRIKGNEKAAKITKNGIATSMVQPRCIGIRAKRLH